jgi:hypothetical protein
MPRTSTAATQNQICPLCGEHLANDRQNRGYVRHIYRAPRSALASRVGRMSADGRVYFNRTGRCPFEIGQRDP